MEMLNTILFMQNNGDEDGSFLLPLLLIFVVMYFFFIRPNMKKNKDQKKFRESLAKGAKIVTIGGVHGKVLEINDETVVIEVEGQSRLKVEKSAISVTGSATAETLQQEKK